MIRKFRLSVQIRRPFAPGSPFLLPLAHLSLPRPSSPFPFFFGRLLPLRTSAGPIDEARRQSPRTSLIARPRPLVVCHSASKNANGKQSLSNRVDSQNLTSIFSIDMAMGLLDLEDTSRTSAFNYKHTLYSIHFYSTRNTQFVLKFQERDSKSI